MKCGIPKSVKGVINEEAVICLKVVEVLIKKAPLLTVAKLS